MGSMEKAPMCLQSWRSNPSPRQLLSLPLMTLPEAIHLFETGTFIQMPEVLIWADYDNLFRYFAYELPSIPVWASTNARTDYFYFSEKGITVDNILQHDAGQNACLLYNEIHPEAPMRVLSPYQRIMINLLPDIKIQKLMPDEPPVPSPRAPIASFSYQRGGGPPEIYSQSYVPFARAGKSGPGGTGQPLTQLLQLPNVTPQTWTLPQFPLPPKPPSPPAQWYWHKKTSHLTTKSNPKS